MIIRKIIKKIYVLLINQFWFIVNPLRIEHLRRECKDLYLNMGCSDAYFNGFINIDLRHTNATYITMDLSRFKPFPGNVKCFFSNAFFEHLYRKDQLSHLTSVSKSLCDDGFICYMGIPYFPAIAKAYLEKGPGTVGEIFDLYNVYRYTHGDPDRMPSWYVEQLHKSLFDKYLIERLLLDSGFKNYLIFTYSFPGDANEVNVNFGFYASKKKKENIKKEALGFLKQFDNSYILIKTIKFI